jgi:hypothetical protein
MSPMTPEQGKGNIRPSDPEIIEAPPSIDEEIFQGIEKRTEMLQRHTAELARLRAEITAGVDARRKEAHFEAIAELTDMVADLEEQLEELESMRRAPNKLN